ncbi:MULTISPECIES: DUF1566 domain-containing protein [Methylobacillus]|uniref:Uncharacterized protein n=1 Tax=Methylobacillus flagellatus (strain ATCC 51484 / DSM 6875 / VKM B-1610 / KT) TaxID=265072 RepID=Q1H296_METFK|nr:MULTISPECIES: DUF1566 domain-containing protein [Methylobacillus]ABE49391.1 hypothetical protein Mfla_1123 [Methylobacillus flagellatus KT]MPS48041.1 DUF1566 domain-containing protein [Methylobacillus sp.]
MYFKPALLASALLFASINAQAELTSYNPNGAELVYSSISNVTWTKDANLLKSMYDADNTLIDKIIAVTPTFNDVTWGLQTLSANNFDTSNGTADWWGALAFVDYLNDISYGGSNQWRLPSVSGRLQGYNLPGNGAAAGDEFPELFYQELGATAGTSIPDTAYFDNEQTGTYWTETLYPANNAHAWNFNTNNGYQATNIRGLDRYVWAVTPGMVAAVPEANTTAMLLAGLGILGAVMRRRRAK